MTVIGVLCWAEESPQWLQAAVTAIAPALDHLVALDGKYYLYPGALSEPSSGIEQSLAVVEACGAAHLGLTLYRPMEPYVGCEVEKRNLSLDLAQQVSDSDDDWVIVFDADMICRNASPHVKKLLAESNCLVGEYARYEASYDDGYTAVRGIYRLVDGLRYGPAHWTVSAPASYLGPTWSKEPEHRCWLWGQPKLHKPYVDEFIDLTHDLKFDHRNNMRDSTRRDKAKAFYDRRDELGIESLTQTWTEGLDGGMVLVKRPSVGAV